MSYEDDAVCENCEFETIGLSVDKITGLVLCKECRSALKETKIKKNKDREDE